MNDRYGVSMRSNTVFGVDYYAHNEDRDDRSSLKYPAQDSFRQLKVLMRSVPRNLPARLVHMLRLERPLHVEALRRPAA
jgi:hypothetical protein